MVLLSFKSWDRTSLDWPCHSNEISLEVLPVRVLLGTGLNATVYGIVVMVGLLTAFQKVANWLCTLENYRTDKEFQDQWVLKMFFLCARVEIRTGERGGEAHSGSSRRGEGGKENSV